VPAFADALDLLAHEFAGLRARRLPLSASRCARSRVARSGMIIPRF
jgi:hypothetical protein